MEETVDKKTDKLVQDNDNETKLQRETINALLEIAPEVLEQIHGGALPCDCCKWEAAIA
jgi:hypothetical protein